MGEKAPFYAIEHTPGVKKEEKCAEFEGKNTFFRKNLLKYLVGNKKSPTFAPAFEKVRCSLTDFHRQKL